MEERPKVSVLILTRNRPGDLEKCLHSLEKQTFRNFETLVIDNGTDEETPQLLKKDNIRSIKAESRGIGYLRNLAVSFSSSPIISFIDNDAVAEPQWLESLMHTFTRIPLIDAVGGPTLLVGKQEMLDLYDQSRHSTFKGFLAKIYETVIFQGRLFEVGRFFKWGGYSLGGSVPRFALLAREAFSVEILNTCNCAIKRTALETVHGFDEIFKSNHEDGDMFLRMRSRGLTLAYEPHAVVRHYASRQAGSRPNAYQVGRDFGYFYGKHARPRSLHDLARFALNLSFFCLYWVYKSGKSGHPNSMLGIIGLVQGLLTFFKSKAFRRND